MVQRFDFTEMLTGFLTVQDADQLYERLERLTSELGFTQFAMGHHVDLVGPPEDAIRLTSYAALWIERSLGERYFADDPIHRYSTLVAAGFLWSEVPLEMQLTARQLYILEAARAYGLVEGYTVPVHVPGEYRGTCSFGTDTLEHLEPYALPIAQIAGVYAFEAARRIMRQRSPAKVAKVPVLTDRQHDALVLVARGKGDLEIGTLLGISKATAHEHVENIRKAYGYAQRTFLIARALFDGQISYHEVFGR